MKKSSVGSYLGPRRSNRWGKVPPPGVMPSLFSLRPRKVRVELNLAQLAAATGYNRRQLAGMMLPLQNGRIAYVEFRRILAARQDRQELGRLTANRVKSVTDKGFTV